MFLFENRKGVIMGVSLEDFMREKNAKPRSVLTNFKEDIQKLLQAGYQTTVIHEYLTRNGVIVSKPTLYQFIQRHGLKTVKTDNSPKSVSGNQNKQIENKKIQSKVDEDEDKNNST